MLLHDYTMKGNSSFNLNIVLSLTYIKDHIIKRNTEEDNLEAGVVRILPKSFSLI